MALRQALLVQVAFQDATWENGRIGKFNSLSKNNDAEETKCLNCSQAHLSVSWRNKEKSEDIE